MPKPRKRRIPTIQPGVQVVRIAGDVENLMPDAWTGASLRALKARGAARDEYPDWDPSYTAADEIPPPYAQDWKPFDAER